MTKPILSIQKLYKTFNDRHVLNNINLDINPGEVHVILGPSGCGKSTLLRCINGLETIDQGSIKFNDIELNTRGTNWPLVRQNIGMVFQSYDLFPHMNVIDNIMLGPIKVQKRKRSETESQANELLNRVGLIEKKLAYPRELSGGQKQRIAIIRALCMNPQIMLFDEVTAPLDPEMVKEVLDVITELAAEGMTMVLVTHELNFARHIANHIVFMDQGNILEISNPKKFFDNPSSLRARTFLSALDF
ncbi:ATP-binding cassette domain-containing protein [Neisseriaceae bacterium PsAf]|nr:ATP-binding cassette domain-containing protein [Neisseriaceae bacterium PsAf]